MNRRTVSRTVNINYENLPDPRVNDWLAANGVDPKMLPAAQEILVSGDHMAYVEFLFKDGRKVLGGHGCLKVIKTVPLISTPEEHGL